MLRVQTGLALLLCLLTCGGCSRGKSTDDLLTDLKKGTEIEAVGAARTLPRAKSDAAQVVPALTEALTHRSSDVRRSSALKLGEFKELAREAIPALQKAQEDDGDARVREAAGIALSRIDPQQFPRTPFKTRAPRSRSGEASAKKNG